MEIKINDYYEPDHFRAICEDNYNISRTCEYEKNEMHHIHNTSEILLVEDGAADYYISGRKYHVEPYDICLLYTVLLCKCRSMRPCIWIYESDSRK